MCHDTIGEQAEQASVPHAALEVGRCVDCHDAHASSQPNLLASPGGAVCTECHSDQAAGEGEVQHGVIDLIGCQACHLPHGGENEMLLRLAGDELCTACHVARGFGARDAQGEVLLLDRFAVPSRLADSIANLRLSVGDEHGHPVSNHRVKGEPTAKELKDTDSTFTEAMSCLTCHDPHKGRSRLILKWGAVSSMEACMNCHPK
jgi:predicted CXXCH cytochrome family protein